jgi:hypothetical protein
MYRHWINGDLRMQQTPKRFCCGLGQNGNWSAQQNGSGFPFESMDSWSLGHFRFQVRMSSSLSGQGIGNGLGDEGNFAVRSVIISNSTVNATGMRDATGICIGWGHGGHSTVCSITISIVDIRTGSDSHGS